jgi:hypothetical protein
MGVEQDETGAGTDEPNGPGGDVARASLTSGRLLRLLRRIAASRAREFSPRTRNALLGVSLLLFAGFVVWSWVSRPEIEGGVRWIPLILAAALMPGIFALKAFEYDAASRVLDQRPSLRDSFEVAVLSSAANLLPVPGSVVVTVHSLSASGSTYGRATSATAAVGVAWLGATGLYGGVALMVAGAPVLGITAVLAGLACVGAVVVLVRSCRSPRIVRATARIFVVETAFVIGSALQYWLVLRAIRVDANIAQTVALTVAASIATAVSIFPSGLGIREVATALISSAVNLPAAAGVIMSVITRIMWLSVLAIVALFLWLRRRGEGRQLREVDDAESSRVRPERG